MLTVVAGLGVLNVLRHLAPSSTAWVGGTATLLLLAHARRSGLSWSALGLGRDHLRSGAVWGLATIGAVAATYLVGVLVPATRPAFVDTRYQSALPQALSTAFVAIPVGTVLLEEVAFRSVLWGLLDRRGGTPSALLVSSALFGLWHVLPALSYAAARAEATTATPRGDAAGTTPPTSVRARDAAPVVLGTVTLTTLGGLVMGELRRRSGSALASAGMHWGTNALGVLFGLAAHRLTTRREQRLTAA